VAVERVRRESEPRHQVNGSVYPNGAAESSLYAGHNQDDDDEHASSVTIEAEPVSEDERFNPVRAPQDKARRDGPAKPKALPKDGASG
jgi:hypothetical protein